MIFQEIKKELDVYKNEEKAAFFPYFFKTGKGEYGEGDLFLGITAPDQRKVAKQFYKECSFEDIQLLLSSPYHEHRWTALVILVLQYEKGNLEKQKDVYEFYIGNLKGINNWDLVDVSCHKIMGAYLLDKPKDILYTFARSKDLWERRIAIVTTWRFIQNKKLEDTFQLAEVLMEDKEDLIHKATGWMLRSAGKRDQKRLEQFLDIYAGVMPRTMLRYALEKFDKQKKQYYMKLK